MSRDEENAELETLWPRLEAFELDSRGAAEGFSARLARENRWSVAHTARVVLEYKRFLALASCAGHPVTPSVAVDRAWHLHLLYTRSYWDDLCGKVLGRRLHHDPTHGGPDEAAKFQQQYQRTLASYRRLFGTEPPADVWPTATLRPRVKGLRWLPAALALFAATLVGCQLNVFDYSGTAFLGFYVIGLVVSSVLSWLVVQRGRRGGANADEYLPSDPYELAMLGGGEERMRETALAALHARGRLDVDAATIAVIDTTNANDLPVAEQALLRSIPVGGRKRVSELKYALQAPASAVRTSLASRGLVMAPERHTRLRWYAAAPLLMMMALGCVKVVVGLERERPIGLLLMLIFISAMALASQVRSVSHRTTAGDTAWARLRQAAVAPRSSPARPSEVANAVALGGIAALAGLPAFASLQRAMTLGQGGAGGCGSGGGGGCDGGGCGGCGGD